MNTGSSGGNMKDNKKERDQELALSQVKKSVDQVYDSIMGNALFILVNIHILIFLLFAEPENLAVYYLLMAVVMIPLYPAYTALYIALEGAGEDKSSIYKRFFEGYRKQFKKTIVLGTLGSFFTAFMLYNSLFFNIIDQNGMRRAVDILLIFVLMFLLGLVPLIAEEKGTLKEHLKKMRMKLFQGVLRGAAALLILFVSVYFGRLIIFPLVIGFSLAAYVQRILYKHQKDRDLSEKQEANKKTRK